MDPIVRVMNLVKRYKDLTAIDHLSLTVEEGEIFGLLGPNGSGKTTLISCILALLKYDQGEIEVFGRPMTSKSTDAKKQMGLVPQEVAVYEELTVQENIDYFCGLYIEDRETRRRCVEEAIQFVQLQDFRKFRPSKLSGGLLRRLNLACGMAHRPRLLILDEPTVAVDPQSRNRILEGIQQLREQGASVIYTSHYMEEIEQICDRLAILDHGKLLALGSRSEILAKSSLKETIRLIVQDLPADTLTALQNNPALAGVRREGTELGCQLRAGAFGLMDLVHLLEEAGASVRSIQTERPTLNDVFLEITGKELRDHA